MDGVDYDPAGADSDHYYLDGKKLVVIKGSYGQDNAEYRTEQDSFSQIISTTSNNALGPASFTVKLKNGLIRTYKPASVKRYSATRTAMTSLGSVYERWLLESEADRSGNSVTFTYTTLDDGNLGVQYLPERISYTKHASGLNAQQLSVLIPHRSVDFAYKDRPDIEFSWEAGVRTSLKKRLVSITMSAPAPGNVAPVWVYRFAYTTSGFSGRSLLSSVQKCGLPGNTCTWKKQFDYYTATPAPAWTLKAFDSEAFSYRPGSAKLYPLLLTLDADGDGADDILLQRGTDYWNPNVLLYTELKGSPKKYQVGDNGSTFTSDMSLGLALPVDLDGDGTSEVFTSKGIVRWTGNTSQTFQTVLNGPINTGRTLLYDLDGDRRLDLVGSPSGPSASAPNVWATSLNLGGIFESPHYPKTPIKRDPQVTTAVDFDGDGRVEIFGTIWARGRSRPTGSPMAWAGRRSSIPMAASRRFSTQTVGPSTCLATSTVTVCRTPSTTSRVVCIMVICAGIPATVSRHRSKPSSTSLSPAATRSRFVSPT